MQHSQRLHIQLHITISDVAKLMGDHPLQLFPIQPFYASPRHADNRVRWLITCGKRVDARLMGQKNTGGGYCRWAIAISSTTFSNCLCFGVGSPE